MGGNHCQMHIDGAWVDSLTGETFQAFSPATGQIIAEIPQGSREDARRAIAAASNHKQKMADTPPFERAKLCHRIAALIEDQRKQIAHVLTLEQGKPYHTEALAEVEECADYFRIAVEV